MSLELYQSVVDRIKQQQQQRQEDLQQKKTESMLPQLNQINRNIQDNFNINNSDQQNRSQGIIENSNNFIQGQNNQNNPMQNLQTQLGQLNANQNQINSNTNIQSFAAPQQNNMNTNEIKSSGNQNIDSAVESASEKYGVDKNLIYAVIQQESGGNAKATSGKGASGIMQLMPATAKSLGVTDIYDVGQNIEAGTKYLSQQLKAQKGNVSLALASYNAGPGNVKKYGGIPPFEETQNYVKKVLGSYYKK